MRLWWAERTPRDRTALVAGGILLGCLLLWVGWIQPLYDERRDLETRLETLQEEYRWMAARAPLVATRREALEASGGRSPGVADGSSLLGIVDVSARTAGLGAALQRVRPLERGVEVELEASVYTDLMRWLVTLEQSHGVEVVSLGLDRASATGRVNARLRLEPAGR